MQAHLLFHKKVGYRTSKNLLLNKTKFSCIYMTIHIQAIYLVTIVEELSLEIILFIFSLSHAHVHMLLLSL